MAERTIVKKVANAVLFSDGTVRIDNVRASYPHLDKAYAAKNEKGEPGEPKFSIVGMLDKKTHVAAKDLLVEVIKDMEKKEDTKIARDKKFIRDGDDGDKLEYEGYWTVSARESRRPSVRHRNGELMSEKEIVDIIYAGCRVNILIRPWFQDNAYGKRANAGLIGCQFVRDDEQIGEGRVSDDGAWDSVDDDGDGMDDGDGL